MKRYITFFFIGPLLLMMFLAQVSAQTHWTKYPGNPVFATGSSGSWDDAWVSWPFVICDSTQFIMYYTGFPVISPVGAQVGRATSPDGTNWTRELGNPVLKVGSEGEWDGATVTSGPIIFDGSEYKMWFGGYDGIQYRNGLATSPDGIVWTKYEENPVFVPGESGQWDDSGVALTSVIIDESVYKTWYIGRENATGIWRVGYATSLDGISWERYAENPVLDIGESGEWDDEDIENVHVLFNGKIYEMWYQGNDGSIMRSGYATSPDGVVWTKYKVNPTLVPESSWEGQAAGISTVLLHDSEYKMWYIGHTFSSGRIGYATAPVTINVPDEVETIQAAIDSAVDGNLVLVEEGTYYENINFKGKAITVASRFYVDGDTSHKTNTIIDGSQHTNPDSGSVVYFVSGEDTNSVLCGFTITGGTGTNNTYDGFLERDGGGISIYYSGATIEHNIITKNVLQSNLEYNFGAGVCAFGGKNDYIIIRDNIIINNTIKSHSCWGAGAGLGTAGYLLFERNIVRYNIIVASERAMGGGIVVDGNFGADGDNIINSNIISFNEAHCSFELNARGGGLCANHCDPTITNNIIFANISDGNGGGITFNHKDDTGILDRPVFINNTVYQNEARYGGGIYVRGSYIYPVVFNSILWFNTAPGGGSQISGVTGNLTVAYSDIQGGWTGEENIDQDPLFEDTVSFKLSELSPCIGAGIDSIEISGTWFYCPDRCFYENLRPTPSETAPDMGACEHNRGDPNKIEDEEFFMPYTFKLSKNYPNPFNPVTRIEYQLPINSDVDLSIFNLLGQKVVTLVSERQPAGSHQVEWDAAGFAGGVYYYRIKAGEFRDVNKMILLR